MTANKLLADATQCIKLLADAIEVIKACDTTVSGNLEQEAESVLLRYYNLLLQYDEELAQQEDCRASARDLLRFIYSPQADSIDGDCSFADAFLTRHGFLAHYDARTSHVSTWHTQAGERLWQALKEEA